VSLAAKRYKFRSFSIPSSTGGRGQTRARARPHERTHVRRRRRRRRGQRRRRRSAALRRRATTPEATCPQTTHSPNGARRHLPAARRRRSGDRPMSAVAGPRNATGGK